MRFSTWIPSLSPLLSIRDHVRRLALNLN